MRRATPGAPFWGDRQEHSEEGMRNQELAQIFEDIAALLTIKGESVYRVAAYRRAAESLRAWGEPAENLAREGRLREIPGVGEAIAEKIDEMVRTGGLSFYEHLTEEVPASLLEVLQVSGVGPKKAALFWKELGITTVEELEVAARDGRLSELPGMGRRSQEKVIEGIEALRRRQTDRMLIGQARPLADGLLEVLRGIPGVVAAEVAGSLRRWRETIGDLDLVVGSDESERVVRAFVALEDVERIKGEGETKASVELKGGVDVQLWVHPTDRYGSALQYATGSQGHNVRLRELAQRQELSLSEHGFKRADGRMIRCAEEAQVYAQLGLPWIPPELREDLGEIQAAQEGTLPELITLSDLRGELHAHTNWSDGHATILEMAQAAVELGVRYLVISDHSGSLGIAGGLSVERLREQKTAIDDVQGQLGDRLRLLQGAEVEILADGSLDYPDEILQELDVVIASLHSSLRQSRERITERLIGAIEHPHVDIIGHPSGRLIGRREAADLDMESVLRAAAGADVALEINAHPDRLDLNDAHARRAGELGCLLAINTDAHQPGDLALRKYGIGVARRAWITRDSVINAWPWSRLERWLARRL
jgi:DNA polymerase (family 10)